MKTKTLIPLFFCLIIALSSIIPCKALYTKREYSPKGHSFRNPYLMTIHNGTGYMNVVCYAHYNYVTFGSDTSRTLSIYAFTEKGQLLSTATISPFYNLPLIAWYEMPTHLNVSYVLLVGAGSYQTNAVFYVCVYRFFPLNGTISLAGSGTKSANGYPTLKPTLTVTSSCDSVYLNGKVWISVIGSLSYSSPNYDSLFAVIGYSISGTTIFITNYKDTTKHAPLTVMMHSLPTNPDYLIIWEITESTLREHKYQLSTNTLTRNVASTTLTIDGSNFYNGLIVRTISYFEDATNPAEFKSYIFVYRGSGIGTYGDYIDADFRFLFSHTGLGKSSCLMLSLTINKNTLNYVQYDYRHIYVLTDLCYPADDRPPNWGENHVWYNPYTNRLFVVSGAGGTYNPVTWNLEFEIDANFYSLGWYSVVYADTSKTSIYFVTEEMPEPPLVEIPQETPPTPEEPDFPSYAMPFYLTAIALPLVAILLPAGLLGYTLGQIGAFLGAILGVMVCVIAGLLPMWVILLVGLALAYLLLKGKIGGGGETNE